MRVQTDALDRDFQTFLRTRDPVALAAVFDAAAPRLLLVAMHLCRDAATAEDLVQTVFLQALRDIDRFDARRPVLPWLLGLLEHRASDARQRAHVRRERSGGPEVAAAWAASGPSPERAAADREVRERVAQALSGLPRDSRDVLTLRLVHGLSSVEIAHAHGLPPATVRTRLRRGLQQLRRALPRGLATPGLLALLGTEMLRASDGLAAVRGKVLAAAGGGVAVGAGWWFALAGCVALACGGWFAWSTHQGPVAADAAPWIDPRRSHAASDVGEPPENPQSNPAGRASVGTGVREAVRDARLTTVHGRVVDAASNQPLAGVTVDLRGLLDGARGDQPADWRDPEPVVTTRDGAFRFEFVPEPVLDVQLAFREPWHVDGWRSFAPLRPGVTVDVGDVGLAAGTPVRLRLVADGRPLPGLQVYAGREQDGGRPNNRDGYGPSDQDGFVDLRVCLPGIWHYEVVTNRSGNESKVEVPAGATPFEHTIELRRPPIEDSVSGVLVDRDGRPVPGVELGIRRGLGYATTITEPDGAFLWRGCTAQQPGHIGFFGARPDLEWIDSGGEVRGGSHGLCLVVRRRAPAALRFEVVDAATGAPVESFGTAAWFDCWTAHQGGPDFRRGALAARPGGIAVQAGLAPGAYFASVFPPPPYAEQAEVPVVLVEGQQTTVRFALQQPAELLVEVVDAASGAPLAGIDVVLARVLPIAHHAAVTLDTFRVDLALARRRHSYSTGTNVLELARGRSDATGLVRLHAPPDVPALVLFAEGPSCLRTLRRDVALPVGGARTRIAVTPASCVRGVLGPRAFVAGFGPSAADLAALAARAATELVEEHARRIAGVHPEVELRCVDGGRALRHATVVDAEGAFAIGGVAAGRYEVWVRAKAPTDSTGIREEVAFGPLQTIELPAAASGMLHLNLSEQTPARATLRVLVDGKPWQGEAGLARLVAGHAVRTSFSADGNGIGRSPALLPGTYVPFASVRDDQGDTRCMFGDERFVLGKGAAVELTAVLTRRVLRVRVVDALGKPVGGLITRLEAIDHPEFEASADRHARTGGDGLHVFDPTPPGRLRLRAFTPEQLGRNDDPEPALLLGDIRADATAVTFTLAH